MKRHTSGCIRYERSRKRPRSSGIVCASPSRCSSTDTPEPCGWIPCVTCASCNGSPSKTSVRADVPIASASASDTWPASSTLDGDELADGPISASALETNDESQLEGICEPPQGFHACFVLPAFDPRDRRMARAHPLGQLLLSETERHAMFNDDSRDLLVRCEAFLLSAVCSSTRPATPTLSDRCAYSRLATNHLGP